MTRLYAWIGGLALLALVVWGAYSWAHGRGHADGYGECRAEYQPLLDYRDRQIEDFKAEAQARQRAVALAQQAREAAEVSLKRQMEDQANAYTDRIRSLEAGAAGARRELLRLRDALETARVSTDSLLRPIAARPGSPADGTASPAERVIRECAEERVAVGGLAARLAEQVIGLQAYARLAQRACGQN